MSVTVGSWRLGDTLFDMHMSEVTGVSDQNPILPFLAVPAPESPWAVPVLGQGPSP